MPDMREVVLETIAKCVPKIMDSLSSCAKSLYQISLNTERIANNLEGFKPQPPKQMEDCEVEDDYDGD